MAGTTNAQGFFLSLVNNRLTTAIKVDFWG